MLQFMVRALTVVFFSLGLASFAYANDVIAVPTQPQPLVITPGAPTIDAKGYILIDANSGKVLAEKNANEHMAPASLTKLMSLYIISAALKNNSIHLDDKVRISTKAWKTDGSRMFIKANDEVPVRDLLQGIIVASGNDATVAMAEYVAGTEETFTAMMNAEAKNLGMENSHFVDSTGLPSPEQYSSPKDLAILAQAITRNFPEDYRLFSQKWFMYKGIRQPNRNRLLWRFQYADGLKTGHTSDAGYCLVSSAIKNGMRLISVIMGAPSDLIRTEDSIRLLTFGFRFYETHKLYTARTPIYQARVWKGESKEIPLGVSKDFFVTMPTGQLKNIKTKIQLNGSLKAPIVKGHAYGNLLITLGNQTLASEPLIALKDIPKGGFFRNLVDAVHFNIERIFSKTNEQANNG